MSLNQFPARFGKYILLDRLNAGGMAEVFRAKVTGVEGFERLVAIKCMLPQLVFDEQFIGMFIDEARLAAQLSHANVVQIYELGRQAERLYIAMELVNGRDLRHILRTAKASDTPIPTSFAAYVISKAAEGLDFAHRKLGVDGSPLNLVHRDVSPQNILVTYDGEVKVVDFGIAKASAQARSTETQAGVLKGKFAYMAPEQVAGESTDRRADIFSLGAVLYEVITGDRLFQGDNDLAVLEKVRDAVIPDLRMALPPAALGLQEVLQHALARRPEQRFTFASEMAESLEEQLIEDRSIFGAKRAAQVMRALYADEVAKLANTLKAYAEVTTDNCIVTIGEAEAPRRTVYESSFDDKTGEVPMSTDFLVTPAPPPAASRSVAGASPRVVLSKGTQPGTANRTREVSSNPETGVGTRPRAMRPALGQKAAAPRPLPQKAVAQRAALRPMALEMDVDGSGASRTSRSDGAARVVRQLSRLAILAVCLTFGLVLIVRTRAPLSLGAKGAGSAMGHVNRFIDRCQALMPVLAEKLVGPAPPDAEAAGDAPAPGTAAADKGVEAALTPPPTGSVRGVVALHVRNAPAGTHLWVDNKDMGPPPIAEMTLAVGVHHVRLVEPGRNGRSKTVEIKVSAQHTHQAPLHKTLNF